MERGALLGMGRIWSPAVGHGPGKRDCQRADIQR